MRRIAMMFVACFTLLTAAAEEGIEVFLMPNGDVAVKAFDSGFAAQRTIISLNTNADCRVCCQVVYRDNMNPMPSDMEEIVRTDNWMNLALETYLRDVCGDLTPEELAVAYREGGVYGYLAGFPEWMTHVQEKINAIATSEVLDFTVLGVSMTAVGEFAERISE